MAQRIPITSTPQTAEKTTRTVKKTPKVFKAAISLVLCFVMFVEMIPPELVWAASDALTSESNLSATETVPYENTILFEDPTLREENKKEYRMSDGSYKAIVYPQPIHYEENGEWQDIDNTLSLDESAGGYTNSASDFSVIFAKKSSSKKLVEIKTDDYKLSWGFVGSNDNKSAKKKTKVSSDDITALNNLSDGLYYNDIYSDVDVEYLLQSKTLKENIILKTKDAQQTFELELKLNKATAVLNSDRTVSIILSDGTEAAKFAAPFMYDAKGVQSNDVAVSLTGSGNKYTLTVTPSKEWLNAEDRAYPVTIDPDVTHSGYNAFSEGYSKSLLEGYLSGENYYVGKYYNSNQNAVDEAYGFWYLFSEFWYTTKIRKAYFCVDTAPRNSSMWSGEIYNNITVNKTIGIHAIEHPFSSLEEKETVDISAPFDIVNVSVDYSTRKSNTPTVCKFDITEYIYSDFYNNFDQFLVLQEYDPPSTVAAGTMPIKFTNARVEFDYRSPDGVEEYLTYTEASVGESGTIYINDATGKVVFAHSGITTPSVTMPISVGNIYQNGKWSTNFSETLYKYNSVETPESLTEYVDKTYADAGYPYSWIDSDGTEIFFHKYEITNQYGTGMGQYETVDETGKRIELTELSNGNVELKDTSKNVSLFEPYAENQYRLVSKTDPYGNYINVCYESSTSTKISTLENNYTEIISFVYDDDGNLIGNNEIYNYQEYAQSITYSYDNSGKLTEITRPDGKKTKLSYSGTQLTGILDVSSGYMVKLVYENNKITLKEYANVPETMDTTDASEGQSMVMTFNGSSTSFRTPGVNGIMEDGENSDDILTVYQFDTYLRTVSAYSKSYIGNEFYGAKQQEYTSGGLTFVNDEATNADQKFGFNKIKNTVSIGKSTENLLMNSSFETGLPSGISNPINYCGAQFDCNEPVTGGGQLSDYVTSAIYSATANEDVYAGEKALKAEITAAGKSLRNTWYVPVARSTSLEPNTEYTFSAFVKWAGPDMDNAFLSVDIGAQEISQQFTAIISDEWQRAEVRFTTPETISGDISFCIKLKSTGIAYVDCVQLEKGPAANAYNYAENQGFEELNADLAPYWWTGDGTIDSNNTYFGNKAYAVVGSPTANKTVTQTITIGNQYKQSETQDYTVSAWAKADALPKAEHTPDRFIGIKARLVYLESDGTTTYSDYASSEFNHFAKDWQYAALSLSAEDGKNPIKIELTIAYNYQIGTCLFDNIGVSEGIVTDYEHDKKGNVTKVSQGSNYETLSSYDDTKLESSVSKNKGLNDMININQYDPYLRNDAAVTHTANIEGEYSDNGKLTEINKLNSVTQYVRDTAGRTIYTQTGTELYAYLDFDNYCVDIGPVGYTVAPAYDLQYILREGTDSNYVAKLDANNYIQIDNFIPDDHFSISFDVGLDKVTSEDYSGQYFITRYDANKQEVLSIYNGGGIVAQFGGQLSNCETQASDTAINVTVTFEKVSDYITIVRFYINGVFQHSQFIESTLSFSENDSDWYIGAVLDSYGNVTNKMSGWIDNLAFFRGILSEAEIRMILKGDYFTLDKRRETADWTEYTYSYDGRYLIKEEHSNGNTTDYTIDYKTGLTTSVLTTSREGVAVRMNYEYNVDKSLKLVYYDSDNDGVQDANEQFNRYNYDSKGNLVSVAHNGTQYTFTYNEWGQRTSAAAGSNTLATYTYPVVNNKAINATITGMTFGGDNTKSQEYIYDEFGNIVRREFGGTLKQEWEYDNKGNLVSEQDYEDDTNAWYQYDAKSRLLRSYIFHDDAYYIASGYAYDKNSNLSEVSHYINGSLTISTSYDYDTDGRFTTANSGSVRSETVYDDITDKLTTRKVSTVGSDDSETLITSETYSYYTSNGTSGLKDAVKEISYNDNSKISYTYDSQGRIKTESRNGTLYVTYTYDKLGQLTEANYHTLNQTHSFYYDNAGNMTSKDIKRGGELLDSITYAYGNESWGDLITYNSQYVTLHDSMGNPIEYISQSSGNAPIDDAYLVWENGRELASINSKATNTPSISYEYNSSGLRTDKIIGTTDHARYLYDDNGNLISEQRSTYALTFYYDGNGVRTHFTHESEAGRHTYYYRYNLQGDVIAILDSTDTVVAEYNYTPYGEHIGTVTGIAADNPFRYRGYYFDNETGYYYLQSRYYNPYTCRLINSDGVANGATSSLLGLNPFVYFSNNPIRYKLQGAISRGTLDKMLDAVPYFDFSVSLSGANTNKSVVIKYDVPLYNQGDYKLCWAFCQVMIEDFKAGIVQTNEQATKRAIEIAKSVHGMDDWNKGGMPTNIHLSMHGNPLQSYRATSLRELYDALEKHGPLYGIYDGEVGHMVVITGVNLTEGIVYTNNPWGHEGEQTFEEFLAMPSWDYYGEGCTFKSYVIIRQ